MIFFLLLTYSHLVKVKKDLGIYGPLKSKTGHSVLHHLGKWGKSNGSILRRRTNCMTFTFSMEMCSYRSATFYILNVTSSDFHEIFTNSQEHRVTHKEMEIPTINS